MEDEQTMKYVIGNGTNDEHCATKNYTETLNLAKQTPLKTGKELN